MMARARRQNPPASIPASVIPHPSPIEAVCIGCGCSDSHACVTAFTLDFQASGLQACFWVKVDYELGIGVCSECVEKVGEFETRILASYGDAKTRGAA
jgi:hypothetical protein